MSERAKKILRYIVGFISIVVIIYMWSDIDVSNYSKEEAIPLIVTSIVVSFIKALIISSVIILLKKIIYKFKTKKEEYR